MKITEEQQKLYDDLAAWAIAYRQGDQHAFEQIYHATLKHVMTYIKLHEIPENDRFDLAQEIYVTVSLKLDTLKEPQAFFKWIMRITANKVADYFRINKKRLDMEVFESESQDDTIGADEQLYRQKNVQERAEDEMISVPESILDNRETQKILFSLVNTSLKPVQAEILYLRCYGEKTYKEIGEILGMPEATVKTQLRRSLGKIEEAILKTEKREGIRLHSVGVIPFVAGMFFVYAGAQEVSAAEASAVFAGVQSQIAAGSAATATSGGTVGTGAAVKGTVGTAAKTAGLSVGKKVLIGIVCAAVAAGGAGAAVHHARTQQAEIQEVLQDLEKKDTEENVVEETPVEDEQPQETEEIKDVVWETASEEARKAFNDFLVSGEMVWSQSGGDEILYQDFQPEDLYFIAADLNGVPTLFVSNGEANHHSSGKAFIYLNGQIQDVATLDATEGIYPNDGVFVMYSSGMGYLGRDYYQVTTSGCNKIAASSEYVEEDEDFRAADMAAGSISDDTYSINGRNCSKEEFDQFVNELLKHSDTDPEKQPELLKNTDEIRKNYFKIESTDSNDSENVVKDSVLSDGVYNLRYIGQRSSASFGQNDSVDMDFSWLQIGDSTVQINMDLGSGKQTYELPLASDAKFVLEDEGEWEVGADEYNNLFSDNTSTYSFIIEMTIQDGKVQKILSTP